VSRLSNEPRTASSRICRINVGLQESNRESVIV